MNEWIWPSFFSILYTFLFQKNCSHFFAILTVKHNLIYSLMCTTVYHSVYISVVSFTVSPFIKPIKFSFWSCNQGQKTDIFLEQSSLPSLSQDQLNLPIDFFNTAAIHCLWHLAVGSLTPFNQINFIFLSMFCKRMSKNRKRLSMI